MRGYKMDNKGEMINSLNDLLQGEYMAIESFNNFINRLEDKETKTIFQNIQKQHRKNAEILADYIQNIGGRPNENIGIKGKMGDIMLNMELDSSLDHEVISKAIEGETKGVNMAEKVLRGNLDNESRSVAGQILQNDRESIKKLDGLR
jgi:uncharacterized protein (TIGR02284 family)